MDLPPGLLNWTMHAPEKIVVLKTFHSPLTASLAKTLLDSFAIPCFLSQEGFTYLYGPVGGGVRLHVFETDQDTAMNILENPDLNMNINDSI